MGFVGIFWKNNIWKAYLSKTSIVGQIVSEILVPFCSQTDDSIQILLNLTQFVMLWTESILEGFVWSHQSITRQICQRQFAFECNFLASRMFFSLSFWMLFFHNTPKNPVIKFHKFHLLWHHTLELYGYYQIQCKCIVADHFHWLPAMNGLKIPFQ